MGRNAFGMGNRALGNRFIMVFVEHGKRSISADGHCLPQVSAEGKRNYGVWASGGLLEGWDGRLVYGARRMRRMAVALVESRDIRSYRKQFQQIVLGFDGEANEQPEELALPSFRH